MAVTAHFTPALFDFLRELRANNNREWFQANKARYEQHARDPMLRFIADFSTPLREISTHFLADPRPVGGSLFRIYRDTRFARDKQPYKTMLAAQFRHASARDVHAPGFYLHLEPDNVFCGGGLYHPDAQSLAKVRAAIVKKPQQWRRVTSPDAFHGQASLWGEQLKRAPAGFDPAHPLIEDLKRKDYVWIVQLDEASACEPGFLDRFSSACRAGAPLVRFLTEAIGQPW
jgi:uncharacterized protein (TIGR02453 family)